MRERLVTVPAPLVTPAWPLVWRSEGAWSPWWAWPEAAEPVLVYWAWWWLTVRWAGEMALSPGTRPRRSEQGWILTWDDLLEV